MVTFKHVVWAGGVLSGVMFALDISMPQVPPPEQGAADRAVVSAAAPDSLPERDAGRSTVDNPPAPDEPRGAQAATAVVAAPAASRAFASLDKGREQKHARKRRTVRRASPRSAGRRLATGQAGLSPIWSDNNWSWTQSWQGQSDPVAAGRKAVPR
jgi:hypothetical protein